MICKSRGKSSNVVDVLNSVLSDLNGARTRSSLRYYQTQGRAESVLITLSIVKTTKTLQNTPLGQYLSQQEFCRGSTIFSVISSVKNGYR